MCMVQIVAGTLGVVSHRPVEATAGGQQRLRSGSIGYIAAQLSVMVHRSV